MGADAPGTVCALGSLKPVLGNLEPVSGAASVAKVALALSHGVFPGTCVETLNPALELGEEHGLRLLDRPTPAEALRRVAPLRAGVNSFADSGVNVHILLEEPPAKPDGAGPPGSHVFPISARSDAVRDAYLRAWIVRLEADAGLDFAALAYTVQRGRDPMASRLAIVTDSTKGLLEALRAVADGQTPANAWLGIADGRERPFSPSDDPTVNAAAWAAGADVDWPDLWTGHRPQVLHGLPTYPFALKRCWLEFEAPDTSPSAPEAAVIRPVADESVAPPAVPVVSGSDVASDASSDGAARAEALQLLEYSGSDVLTIMRGLRMIVAAFLEIGPDEPINEAANFSEIGLTSMSIVAFIEEVNRRFHVDLPEIAIFDYPNLEELASHISAERAAAGASADPPKAQAIAAPTLTTSGSQVPMVDQGAGPRPASKGRPDLQAILSDLASDMVTVDEVLERLRANP